MKLIYLKSALKCDSFDVAIDIKIQIFRVLVTIEPGRSLLQLVTTNCLICFAIKINMRFKIIKQNNAPFCSNGKNLNIKDSIVNKFLIYFSTFFRHNLLKCYSQLCQTIQTLHRINSMNFIKKMGTFLV